MTLTRWRFAPQRLGMLLGMCWFTACARAPRSAALSPVLVETWRTEIAQLVMDSVYRRGAPVALAVVLAPSDTTCRMPATLSADVACPSLASRWGVEQLWFAKGDSASARGARDDLLRRAGQTGDLRIAAHDGVSLMEAQDVPFVGAPRAQWHAFRAASGGAAGALRFSPVGFSPSARHAVVIVDWRCGPTCGHVLGVALVRPTARAPWALDEMLLLSSAQGNAAQFAPGPGETPPTP
jgi:hypothetical protein